MKIGYIIGGGWARKRKLKLVSDSERPEVFVVVDVFSLESYIHRQKPFFPGCFSVHSISLTLVKTNQLLHYLPYVIVIDVKFI